MNRIEVSECYYKKLAANQAVRPLGQLHLWALVAGNILACGVAVLIGFGDLGYRLYRRLRSPQPT